MYHMYVQDVLLLLGDLSQTLLQGLDSLVEITPAGIGDRDTHVAEANVPGSNLLVQTTGEDDAPARELGQDLGWRQALRQVDCGHAVGLVLGL